MWVSDGDKVEMTEFFISRGFEFRKVQINSSDCKVFTKTYLYFVQSLLSVPVCKTFSHKGSQMCRKVIK